MHMSKTWKKQGTPHSQQSEQHQKLMITLYKGFIGFRSQTESKTSED
jgi:hypothetical protein